jgi:hypothetical protein
MRGIVFWLAIGVFGSAVPAAADPLALTNCTTDAPMITTFNESDPVCAVPQVTTALHSCSTVVVVCDGRCKVNASQAAVGLGSTSAAICGTLPLLGGEQTFTRSGDLVPTASVRSASDESSWSQLCTCSQAEMRW